MASLRSLARLSSVPRSSFSKANVSRTIVQSKRHASFYNSDVAGLNGEEAEVCYLRYRVLFQPIDDLQFRNVVTEFAQREIAPQAAEIDKTNTFPSVNSHTFLFAVLISNLVT